MTNDSSDRQMPKTADELAAFMDGLTFTDEPVHNVPPRLEDEPLVVRSLRLPASLEIQARRIAEARGVAVTVLMREWIAAAVVEITAHTDPDPVVELGRKLTEATRAYEVLVHRQSAA